MIWRVGWDAGEEALVRGNTCDPDSHGYQQMFLAALLLTGG